MLNDLLVVLINFFIIEPILGGLTERLAQLGASRAVIQDVASCAAAAQPVLTEHYLTNPVQGLLNTLQLWTGMTTAQELLTSHVPACQPAISAAEPFLRGGA